jgi:hypothetical protein
MPNLAALTAGAAIFLNHQLSIPKVCSSLANRANHGNQII